MTISARIRTLREERGMSQVALAQAMGVTQSHISQVERDDRGGRYMSYAALEQFAIGLGVPVETLFRGVAFPAVTPAPVEASA